MGCQGRSARSSCRRPSLALLAGLTWEAAVGFVTTGSGAAIARFALDRRQGGSARGALPSILGAVAAASLAYGLLLMSYELSAAITAPAPACGVLRWLRGPSLGPGAMAIALVALGAGIGLATNANYTSPHRMYRDRLMEAFMPPAELVARTRPGAAASAAPDRAAELRAFLEPDGALLSEMGLRPRGRQSTGPQPYPGPYHIINTNLVVGSSSDPSLRDRGGESFMLSPLYCGSRATGWRRTDRYATQSWLGDRSSTMTLATAMAVSAAAANPHTGCGGRGVTRSLPVGFAMALLNIRLGYFEVNPDDRWRRSWFPARPNHIVPGLAELFALGAREDGHFVELSDGGHFENLGVYELLRREVDLIICADGGADPDFGFADLATLIERARVDFGINIDFVPRFAHQRLAVRRPDRPDDTRPEFATPGFALARIAYPPQPRPGADPGCPEAEAERGKLGLLVYLKPTVIKGLPADLLAYRSAHPAFPHQTTVDQFFDEAQFEAYRELGYRIARATLEHSHVAWLLGAKDVAPAGGTIAPADRIAALAEGHGPPS